MRPVQPKPVQAESVLALAQPSQQRSVLWSQPEPMAQAGSALVLPSQQELSAPPPEPVMRLEAVSARPVAPPWPGRPLRPAAPVQVPQAWLQAWARVWLRPRVQASIRAWG
ncbi:hypothetical protein DF3PA_50038 [Candidatus Defluviicoccus seviourii]|uniref:Uncharacterized protein n=2 Tax=root TaxID=1 RepID=A0A564WGF9_9PROT|nr:hypothetical protein DF3PB_430013 [uncultured Defluviicoccus sp.]VUX47391.1 hypothetical protein DF3PA_50038 [Candidatus Defluviicoccus seviourii]